MFCKPKDEVTRQPDIATEFGRAWRVDLERARETLGGGREDATVEVWVVEAPWAHPCWRSYAISLVHLRPLPGFSPPLLYQRGVTHELLVWALNPDHPRLPTIDGSARFYRLEPRNFGAQIIEPSDEAARARVRSAVEEICSGTLSPDTDFIREWVRRFGDNMLKGRQEAGHA